MSTKRSVFMYSTTIISSLAALALMALVIVANGCDSKNNPEAMNLLVCVHTVRGMFSTIENEVDKLKDAGKAVDIRIAAESAVQDYLTFRSGHAYHYGQRFEYNEPMILYVNPDASAWTDPPSGMSTILLYIIRHGTDAQKNVVICYSTGVSDTMDEGSLTGIYNVNKFFKIELPWPNARTGSGGPTSRPHEP